MTTIGAREVIVDHRKNDFLARICDVGLDIGLPLPRVVIAVLEGFQQADGSVAIPEVLRSYTGFDRIP